MYYTKSKLPEKIYQLIQKNKNPLIYGLSDLVFVVRLSRADCMIAVPWPGSWSWPRWATFLSSMGPLCQQVNLDYSSECLVSYLLKKGKKDRSVTEDINGKIYFSNTSRINIKCDQFSGLDLFLLVRCLASYLLSIETCQTCVVLMIRLTIFFSFLMILAIHV